MTTGSSTEGWFTARLSQRGAVAEVRGEPRHPGRRLPSQLICIRSMAVMTHTTNEASNRTGELSITPAVSSSLYANVRTAPCQGVGGSLSRALLCAFDVPKYGVTAIGRVCLSHSGVRQAGWQRGKTGRSETRRCCLLWSLVTLSATLLPSFSGVGRCCSSNENALLIAVRGRRQKHCGKTNQRNI